MEGVSIRAGLLSIEPPRLLGGRCADCGRRHFPAQPTCPYCAADDCETVALSERGTLYLYTVVHNAPPGFRGTAPYGFGVIELPEGLRIISPLTESRIEMLRVGMPMRLRIAPLFRDDEGRDLFSYAFEPMDESR
jgi:uncharacterized OB-fold protein